MKSTFAQNIKKLRKEEHVTQEQLAEAMGVTPGAIYKWEQNLSVPDIGLIMELASYFGVSVDALIGYTMSASDKERIVQTLKKIKVEKTYENCWDEIEGWLRRYPNDFDIVYHSGILYHLVGIETHSNDRLARSIELMNHACTLIGQNRDPEISETGICRDIAIAYLSMGECDRGLEQLKAHNPCGINDDIIGQELSWNPKRREEALQYLSLALLHSTASLYRITIGFVNLFVSKKEYLSAIWIIQWTLNYLEGLRKPTGNSYLEKDMAAILAVCGDLYTEIGEMEQAKICLQKARRLALCFDAAPDYTSRHIRYCESVTPRVAYDNMGVSAMDTIEQILREDKNDPAEPILKIWEEVCNEE